MTDAEKELRELIATWREVAELLRHADSTIPISATLMKCADAVETILGALEAYVAEMVREARLAEAIWWHDRWHICGKHEACARIASLSAKEQGPK